MCVNGWPVALLSRAVSVLALSLAIAWLAGVMSQIEFEETSQMSHQDLLAYLREGANTPFWATFAGVLLATAIYVLLVELLALGFRALVRGVAPEVPVRSPAPLFR